MGLIDGAIDFEIKDFFSDFAQDLKHQYASDDIATNIIDFIENEVDLESWLGPGGALTDRQLAILKCFDGLPLTEHEQALIQAWSALDRTTYDLNVPPKRRQALVLESGRGSGKCSSLNSLHLSQEFGMIYGYEILGRLMGISRNSLLLSEEGIKNLAVQSGLEDLSFALTDTVALEGKAKRADTSAFYVKGLAKTKKVTTAAGYSLEATPEHRVKIMNSDGNIDWAYFSDIKEGDYVCIHRNTYLFPDKYLLLDEYAPDGSDFLSRSRQVTCQNVVLDADFGYLLGLLTANGSWTVRSGLNLSHHVDDAELYYETMSRCMSRLGLQDHIRTKSSSANGMLTACGSMNLRQMFDRLGFTLESRVNKKKTPWSIRQSPRDVQASYLSGLFDGDGSVEKGGACVTLSTASKLLASETQLLLLNFGIVSTVRKKIVKGNPYYILSLRGQRSLKLFTSEIGFKLSRKQQPLEDYMAQSGKDGSATERVPHQKVWLQRIRDSLPNNMGRQPGSLNAIRRNSYDVGQLRNLRLEYRAIVGNCVKDGSSEMLSSYRLDKLIAFAEEFSPDQEAINHFKHIQDCDYFYDPVASVEDTESFCVDLCVPGHEQYVAQGMTNHNTFIGGIILGYEWYKLCMRSNPQRFFGVAANTLISIYCLAPAASATKKTIFGQARAFLNYIPKVKRLIDNKSIIVGEEEVKYPEKLLYIYAGNSKGGNQVGSRVILLVMDEVARFENKDGDSNALELWSNIGVSGITFGEHSRRVAISSAWSEGDAIQRLWLASKSEPSWVGFRFRTWDVNPSMGRDNPLVTAEYNLEPNRARLEFEGDRTVNSFTFFAESEIREALTGHVAAVIEPAPYEEDGFVKLKVNSVEVTHAQTYMHLDPAFTGDAYGMCFGHGEVRDGQKVVVIDGLAAWEPEVGRVVSIMNVYEVIYKIHNARRLFKVTTDHAQQHETIQRLKLAGINASSRFWSNRVQVEIYDFTRKMLHEGRVILPKNSPWTHLLKLEMMGVMHNKEKNKIEHPKDGGKDLCDCLCSVVWEIAGGHQGTASAVIGSRSIRDKTLPLSLAAAKAKDEEDFSSNRRELVSAARRYKGGFSNEYDF